MLIRNYKVNVFFCCCGKLHSLVLGWLPMNKAKEKNTWTSSSFSQKSSPNILSLFFLITLSFSISDTHHQLSWLEGLDSDYHDNARRVLMNKSPLVPKSGFAVCLSYSLLSSQTCTDKTHVCFYYPAENWMRQGHANTKTDENPWLQTQCFDLESLLAEYDGLPVIVRGWAIDVALI